MPVFDPGFVAEMRRKNASRPASYRTDMHFVATSEERSGLRAWIEREVELLPEPGRTKLTGRLRKDDNFVTAVNELAVSAVLHDAGLAPVYEPECDGLTPDLIVPVTADRPAIIVDVWTRQPPAGEASRRRGWESLRERVAKIPVGVGLILEPRTRKGGHPERSEVAEIGRVLQDWLMRAHRPAGAVCEVLGYRFRAYGTMPGSTHAVLARPSEGGAVDTHLVLRIVTEKTRKYREIARKLGAAFVVVLAAEPGTPLDLGMVRAALAGEHAMAFLVPPAPVGPLGDVTTRLRAELKAPDLDPALSAVGWVSVGLGEPALVLIDNPAAAVPLPSLETEAISREP